MQSPGIFISALPELASRMQVGQHQLDRRHIPFGVHVHRDASPVIANRDGAIYMNGNLDLAAESGQVFVNGVVEHLKNTVMQAALVRVADIHSRAFAHRLQPFQLIYLGRIILLGRG